MRPTTRHAPVIEGVLSTLECMNGPRECAGPVKIREGGFVLCDKHWVDRPPRRNYPTLTKKEATIRMNVALAALAGAASVMGVSLIVLVVALVVRGTRRGRRAVDLDILRAMGQQLPPGDQRETGRGQPPEVGSLFTPQPNDH